ncbi:hypothetical protein F4820DRAFT_443780 [Hypoxylon rubiginosum]|uniref:Uncharacterized protein n=1 Tax=Hypoxylon rubiginosum TaxID=110542 RepID=A0ACB9ZEA2_9PEZI|nr:hypothetical protein F4820DRAFT_443780 [Hypoxylon rubiginosum]
MAFEFTTSPVDESAVERLVGRRSTMTAWKWEHALLTYEELQSLRTQPCKSTLDFRLLALIGDWGTSLKELSDRELASPARQVANQAPCTFSELFFLVSSLFNLVNRFYIGDPSVCRTRAHHYTVWPGTPRSDVTQARFTVSALAFADFGIWLENCTRGAWELATAEMYHSFVYNSETRLLGWAYAGEWLYPPVPLARMSVDLLFRVLEDVHEVQERHEEPAPLVEQQPGVPDPEFSSGIYAWMDGITGDSPGLLATLRSASSVYGISEPADSEYDSGYEADVERSSVADDSERGSIIMEDGDVDANDDVDADVDDDTESSELRSEGGQQYSESLPADGMSASTESQVCDTSLRVELGSGAAADTPDTDPETSTSTESEVYEGSLHVEPSSFTAPETTTETWLSQTRVQVLEVLGDIVDTLKSLE